VSASAPGNEAWDCEQVVVTLIQLNPRNSGSGQTGEWAGGSHASGGAVNLPEAYLQVQIVRCIPTPTQSRNTVVVPSVEDDHAAGLVAMQDAALLHAVRSKLVTSASLTFGAGADVRLGPIVPAGADGGFAGMALVVGATLV